MNPLAIKAAASVGWGLLKRFWWAIPVIVLIIMLLDARGDARHWEKKAERRQELLVEERQAHSITRQSLAGARGQIDDNNRRIEEANKRLEEARRTAAADEARAAARWRSTAATIAELEAAARDGGGEPCEVSPEALRALEGL